MELENLVKLIQTVSDSDLTGFQYEENGVKLKIQKEKEQMVVSTGAAQMATVQNVPGAQSNVASALKPEDEPEKGKEAEGLWLEPFMQHRRKRQHHLWQLAIMWQKDRRLPS